MLVSVMSTVMTLLLVATRLSSSQHIVTFTLTRESVLDSGNRDKVFFSTDELFTLSTS